MGLATDWVDRGLVIGWEMGWDIGRARLMLYALCLLGFGIGIGIGMMMDLVLISCDYYHL